MKKIGLVLSSGGARGLSHIAFLKVFDELGIKPSIIAGSSMGAAIGAMYSSGMTGKEIEEFFTGINLRKMAQLLDLSKQKREGFFKGDRVIDYYGKQLKSKTFEELKIPLKVVATDFWNHSEVVFDKGDLLDAVRASASLPGVLQPKIIDGAVLIDGGVVNPLPLDIIKDECDIIIAIDVSSENTPYKNRLDRPKLFEGLFSTMSIMQGSIIKNKIMHMKPDIYVKVPFTKRFTTMEFYRSKEIIESAKEEAEKFKIELTNLLNDAGA